MFMQPLNLSNITVIVTVTFRNLSIEPIEP